MQKRPSILYFNPFSVTAEQIRISRFIDSEGEPERHYGAHTDAALRAAVSYERSETNSQLRRLLADHLRLSYVRPFLKFKPIASITTRAARRRDLAVCRELLTVIRRLEQPTEPPAAVNAITTLPCDPRDGDGWAEAVEFQGVRVPHYSDGYLQSTHWELLQEERRTGVCERCQRARRTQLHHVTYERLGAERAEDTRELCDQCHRREHPRTWLKAAA